MSEGDGGGIGEGFRCLVRRKRPDSPRTKPEGQQLAKRLSAFDLVAIGVGSTIGAGVYILIGTVARELTGPGLVLSFLIGGIAAALSALCYAELACRCPSAGSAYHYSYICVGEGVAWLIGWALILEYTLGSATVARGISPNLALFFGGVDKLPGLLTRHTIFGLVVDPCAALLVCAVALLLCLGIKESSLVQTTVTIVNVGAMLFVLIAGVYLGFKTGWPGYDLPSGYFPFGINGIFAGSATLFYSYVGFDSVTSTAEEVKNPQRDMPIGIGFSLSVCCILYMLVSAVIVGLVPYYALDPDTPISSAFASNGMEWAEYIITIGAVTALCSGLIGGILPQPRILMAMSRDGLLPSFFSDINKRTKVPVKSTVVTGLAAAALAFSMDIEQLAGMVSVGTLLAFTAAAISVLIVRYVPPDEIPYLPSLQDPFRAVSLLFSDNIQVHKTEREKSKSLKYPVDSYISGLDKEESSAEHPLLDKVTATDEQIVLRQRKVAAWNIGLVCTGALVLSSSVSANGIPSFPRYALSALGLVVFSCSLIGLISIKQSDAWRSSASRGGFLCPFVPVLPACCILINIYLLINLGVWTWIRASVWLVAGVLVYLFYGRTHSKLSDRLNIPVAFAAQISQTSQHCH